jgi:hypothetical protein
MTTRSRINDRNQKKDAHGVAIWPDVDSAIALTTPKARPAAVGRPSSEREPSNFK